MRFQGLYLLTDGAGRHVQCVGGLLDTALPANLDKGS